MNQNKILMLGVFIIVVVLLVGGAAVFLNMNTQTPSTNTDTSGKSVVAQGLTFALSEQNNSGQTGTVVLQDVGAQVQVTVEVTNVTSDVQPAHIHVGTCPTPGSVVYPLQDLVDGKSVTLLNTTLAELKERDSLAVNIHKSASESSVYYSCGNLTF